MAPVPFLAQMGRDGPLAGAAFFGGMLVIAVVDRLIPEEQKPHEVKSMEWDPKAGQLMRMGGAPSFSPECKTIFVLG